MTEKKNASSVAVIMGSNSDMPVMQCCIDQLKEFDIEPVVRVISAHRTPILADDFAESAPKQGVKVIIAAAGMAAHLAGAMAGRSHLPIIGVPMLAGEGLCGLDALLSTVQMPPGVPVASMAIGKAGAKNAAVFAAQILATGDKNMEAKVIEFRRRQTEEVIAKDKALNS